MLVTRWIRTCLWITSAFAVAYTAWVFTGRIVDRRRLAQNAARKAALSQAAVEAPFLGRDLKIVQFYARDGVIARGETTLLCYSVVNAAILRIEPPIGEVPPSANRCLKIAPTATVVYRLTAEDSAGKTVSEAVTVHVNPR